jgi:3-demethoxyubiquinol 3-hydroxylase
MAVALVSAPGDRILKVDHAGEHGAIAIYKAQIWVAMVTTPELVPQLTHFLAHELRHRTLFWAELSRRRVARCRSYHLCALGGFSLGLITALLGRRAIAATTVAVEHVVLQHLTQQIATLRLADPAASATIQSIVKEEREHHDRSAQQLARPTMLERGIMAVVRISTESVIWLGMRL